MSFANSKPFYIAKASESGNENTCHQLAATITPSLSPTTTSIPHLFPSIGLFASTLSL